MKRTCKDINIKF